MSVSDNSTIAPMSDVDLQSLDENAESQGLGVGKRSRRVRRPLQVMALHSSTADKVEESSACTLKSPYADAEIVVLQVGANATLFSVHGHHFAKSAVLAAKYDPFSMAEQHVCLPEIDEATAHALVHYLYTDRYDDVLASSDSPLASYKLGTCVYCAAVRYELPVLAELAKEKVTSLSDAVAISDVLVIAKNDAFRLLPENEAWYASYLEAAVRSAMARDPEPFRRSDFITQIEGNTRLLQVVWKTVMSAFAHTSVAAETPDKETEARAAQTIIQQVIPVAEPELEAEIEVVSSEVQSCGVAKPESPSDDAAQDAPLEPIETNTTGLPDAPPEDTLKLDEIEPTVERTQPLESFTDELGYETSGSNKTYHKMKDSGADPGFEQPEVPVHKRSDSVIQVEKAVMTPADEEAGVVDGVDGAQAKVGGVIEGGASQKKSKKGKKKKLSNVF